MDSSNEVAKMDLEMAKLSKEFDARMAECNKKFADIKQTSQQIEAHYNKELEAVSRYCDEVAKKSAECDESEARLIAQKIKR